MGTSPSQYLNNPSPNTNYYAYLWAGCIGAAGDYVTANVRAYHGNNGTGGEMIPGGLEVWLQDFDTGVLHGHNGPRNDYSWISCADTIAGGDAGHVYRVVGRCTGSGVGSFQFWTDFNTSGFYYPGTPTFYPSVGGPGTAITLSGNHFTDATQVTFNGTNDPTFAINNDDQITAHVPAGATYGPIYVINPVGSAWSATNFTPGTLEADSGNDWQYVLRAWADSGNDWQGCKVWADDGNEWRQIG